MATRVLGIFSCINEGIIGYDGNLLFTHPTDFKNFKELTMDKTLLVGYKTAKEIFERNPNGLKGREIAILVDENRPNLPEHDWLDKVYVVKDPIDFIETSDRPIVIAGGTWVFNKLWCHVTEWHITHFAVNIDDIFYIRDDSKISKFVVPDLPSPIDRISFQIELSDGSPREASITTHLIQTK